MRLRGLMSLMSPLCHGGVCHKSGGWKCLFSSRRERERDLCHLCHYIYPPARGFTNTLQPILPSLPIPTLHSPLLPPPWGVPVISAISPRMPQNSLFQETGQGAECTTKKGVGSAGWARGSQIAVRCAWIEATINFNQALCRTGEVMAGQVRVIQTVPAGAHLKRGDQ